jgi:hypothetical protein
MADDRRLNFDAGDDMEIVKRNLLEDVAAATKEAKDRKEQDKIRDAQLKTKAKDRTTTFVIVAIATVILLALAYWTIFVRGNSNEAVTHPQTPVNRPAVPNYRVPPPRYTPQRPMRATPPSEPIRRNASDTYEDGPGSSGM